jgi:hypothetical protein
MIDKMQSVMKNRLRNKNIDIINLFKWVMPIQQSF